MFTVIKPPFSLSKRKFSTPTLFLAGSIEMGVAENWQNYATDFLEKKVKDLTIFNPRRDGWDSSWEQNIENPQFFQQVEWELRALSLSNTIIMYLDPNTKSPISLLELGLHAKDGKLMVVCPEGYWRKGNVDIVCNMYNVPQFDTLDDALDSFCTSNFINNFKF